jgi:cytosine/adenosine deaminase-related metal-dependent hydrolase
VAPPRRRPEAQGTPGDRKAAVGRNLAASLAAGTTLLADTTTAGLSWDQVARAPVRGVVFAELIGLRRLRGLQTSRDAWDWIAAIGPEAQVAACARPGLSPHAPYSTSGWLYHQAAASRLPLSTHLAELPEELELLRRPRRPAPRLPGGPRRLGRRLGADRPPPRRLRPQGGPAPGRLADRPRHLPGPLEFWQLRPEAAPDGQRVAVAYCPRTHARFGHAPHPFRAMLRRGVVVCLGTDSLASAPSLSLLDEIRFLHRADGSLGGPLL